MLAQLASDVPHLRPAAALQSKMDQNSLQHIREQAQIFAENCMLRSGRDDLLSKEKIRKERKEQLRLDAEREKMEQEANNVSYAAFSIPPQNDKKRVKKTPKDPYHDYYLDSASGYYIFPQLQLYYHPITQLYYAWDAVKNEYVAQSTPVFALTQMPEETVVLNSDEPQPRTAPIKFSIKASGTTTQSKPVALQCPLFDVKLTENVENEPAAVPIESFSPDVADFSRLHCLLCQRGFKKQDLLNTHLLSSELHKKNVEIERLRKLSLRYQQSVAASLRRQRIVDTEAKRAHNEQDSLALARQPLSK